MISTRPAKPSDIANLHPEAVGVSYRAWAIDLDDEPVGVIGLALTRPRACLFCAFTETLRPHLRSMPVMRLLKRVELVFKARRAPIFAIRERDEPKAAAMLERLGLRHVGEHEGDEVWMWGGE